MSCRRGRAMSQLWHPDRRPSLACPRARPFWSCGPWGPGTGTTAGAGTQAQGSGEEGRGVWGCPGGCRSRLWSDLWAGSCFGAPALLDGQGEVSAAFPWEHRTAGRGHCSGQPRLLTAGGCPAPAGFPMSSDQETPRGWEADPEARADLNLALGLQSPLTLSWPAFPALLPCCFAGGPDRAARPS